TDGVRGVVEEIRAGAAVERDWILACRVAGEHEAVVASARVERQGRRGSGAGDMKSVSADAALNVYSLHIGHSAPVDDRRWRYASDRARHRVVGKRHRPA